MDSSRVYAEMAVANWQGVIHRQKRRDGTLHRRVSSHINISIKVCNDNRRREQRGRNTPTMIRLDRNAQYIMLFTLLRKSEGRRRAKNRQGKSRRGPGLLCRRRERVSFAFSPSATCHLPPSRPKKKAAGTARRVYILHSIGFPLKVR